MIYFIDANVPMYAAGRPSEFEQPCREILLASATGVLDAVTDVEVLQDIVHRFAALRRLEHGIVIAKHLMSIVSDVLPVDAANAAAMFDILGSHKNLEPRDALHYAVMLRHGITHILTADAHFDALPGITRIDPRNADAIIA